MGSSQSYLTPETVVTAAVLAGAVGFGYKQIASSPSTSNASLAPSDTPTAGKKGKGKKNKAAPLGGSASGGSSTPVNAPTVVPFPSVIPGQFDDQASGSLAGLGDSSTSSKAKQGKKKKVVKAAVVQEKNAAGAFGNQPSEDSLVTPAAAAVLADSTSDTRPAVSKPTKSKKQKQQKQPPASQGPMESPSTAAQPTTSDTPKTDHPSSAHILQKSTASLGSLATDTDGEWTRVSRRVDKAGNVSVTAAGTSDLGHTTSATTGTSSSVDAQTEEDGDEEEDDDEVLSGPGERHPLAKRLLPKPRKTGVEDMLTTSDYPSYSRVMRVQPQPGDKPAAGFSWADYEDVIGAGGGGPSGDDGGADADGEDDGWGVVKRGGRPRDRVSSSTQGPSTSQTAPETITKRQRQNAAKREAQKTAKADAERERLATLAKHKRELERTRIEAQYAKGESQKATSGGMKATIDAKGKLVWD